MNPFATTNNEECVLYGCPSCKTVQYTTNQEYIQQRKDAYKSKMKKNNITLKDAKKVLCSIVGKRFNDEHEIADWIRNITACSLPNLVIGELQDAKTKPEFNPNIDDFMNCSFGENECGMEYADFILYAIKTNANQLYITEANWMY